MCRWFIPIEKVLKKKAHYIPCKRVTLQDADEGFDSGVKTLHVTWHRHDGLELWTNRNRYDSLIQDIVSGTRRYHYVEILKQVLPISYRDAFV